MVTQLGERVWWVDLTGVNAYLVDDGGTVTLVDAGLPWDGRRLVRAVAAAGHSVGDVERVLVTHYDIDHVGALAGVDGLDATVFVGRADRPYLVREARPSLAGRKELLQRAVDWWRDVPDLPVEAVDDGDTVGSFTAYHAPGHTAGHTVFSSDSLSVAFLGDVVRESGGRFEPSPWLICQDYGQNLRTIPAVAGRLPDVEIACPGHGVPFVEHGHKRLSACADRVEADT